MPVVLFSGILQNGAIYLIDIIIYNRQILLEEIGNVTGERNGTFYLLLVKLKVKEIKKVIKSPR